MALTLQFFSRTAGGLYGQGNCSQGLPGCPARPCGKITWPAELYEKVSLTAGDWEIKDG